MKEKKCTSSEFLEEVLKIIICTEERFSECVKEDIGTFSGTFCKRVYILVLRHVVKDWSE